MIFGFLYVSALKYGFIDDSVDKNLWSRSKIGVITFLSLACLAGYTAFTFTCRNKPECNTVHAYVAYVPVIH